jgi:outer membrane protein
VAAVYFTVAWRRDRLRLAEEWVRWAERQLSVIETESGLGLSTPQEIEVARADLDLRRLALQAAQRAAEQAMRQLSLRIGLTDETDLRFDETLPGLPTLPSLTSLLEKAASEHPEVEIQQTALDRSKLNLTLARAQRRPKVTLESGYTFADDFSAPGNNFFLASLKLEMPLYDFGDYRAAYTEAQTKSRLEEIRLEAVRSDLRATVTEAYGQLLDAEGRVSVAEKELTLADLRHGTVTAQREQGLVGPREPLAAERNRIELRQSLADLRHELRLKYAALQKASGGGFRWVP